MEALESENPDDLKNIIRTYVDKVIVSQDSIEIHLIVHSNGGGEGTLLSIVSNGADYILNFF